MIHMWTDLPSVFLLLMFTRFLFCIEKTVIYSSMKTMIQNKIMHSYNNWIMFSLTLGWFHTKLILHTNLNGNNTACKLRSYKNVVKKMCSQCMLNETAIWKHHCLKNVRIWSFLLFRIFPLSGWIRISTE